MKAKLSLIILLAVMACACTPDGHERFDFSNYTIDKVVCSAGSNYLVADGVSELDLGVTLYTRTGTYTDIYGVERDLYMEIPVERWRAHEVKFYVNGAQVTPPYTITDASAATLLCYAEVDGIRSTQSPAKLAALYPPYHEDTESEDEAPEYPADPDPFFFEVTVREAFTPPARRIPVVFHIIDLDENHEKGQDLRSSAVYAMTDLLNKVYGRRNGKASNGANPNLEFVPALRDDWGGEMKEPGIDRVYLYGEEAADYMKNPTAWIWNLDKTDDGLELDEGRYYDLLDAGELPERWPRVFWDPDRYLNIWVLFYSDMPSPSFSDLAREYFPWVYPEGVFDGEQFPIPEGWDAALRIMDEDLFEMWKLNPYDLRLPPESFSDKIKSLGQAGIFMAKSEVANYRTNIVQYVGAFFGLIPNSPLSRNVEYQNVADNYAWADDFCADTPVYNRWFDDSEYGGLVSLKTDGTVRVKYTMTPPYYVYRSFNAMESGSASSFLSQDQVRRMQWALENAPARQMWKNTEAID